MGEVVKKSKKNINIKVNAPGNKLLLSALEFKHGEFEGLSPADFYDGMQIKLWKYDYKRGLPKLDIVISSKSFTSLEGEEPEFSNTTPCLKKYESVLSHLPVNMLHILDSLISKFFIWVVKNVTSKSMFVDVYITIESLPFQIDNDVVMWFTGKDYSAIKYLSLQETKKFYAKDFFKELKDFQSGVVNFSTVANKVVQHKDLITSLRTYQRRAVQWMLDRECGNFKLHNSDWLSDEVTTLCGKKLYYYPYSGMLSENKFPYGIPNNFPGGILADEMGLGKTLVVISLILSHPCGNCVEVSSELKSIQNSLKREHEVDSGCSDVPPKKPKVDTIKGGKNSGGEFSIKSKMKQEVRCVCGVMSESTEGCVQCPGCSLFQHKYCVGYEKGFTYFCPSCWPNHELLKSKATLIVAPTSICHQWKEEIEKHVDKNAWDRGVFVFNSVERSFIQPSVLASYDIVITTYSSLPSELPHTVQKRVREFRHKRQYLRKCSPLALIEWWRICLDEAQLVEVGSPNYIQISEMAKLIPAVNRWSVTGTPIQKSVNDLYYLFNWMGVKPFEDRSFWDKYLYNPYLKKNPEPLFSVLSQVFWRNSKEEVEWELNIPEQVTEYHMLTFSAIEQTFYMEQHANVVGEFLEGLRILRLDLNRTLDSLDSRTLDMVLAPLLSLRQACSHHLAVGNQLEYMMEQKKGMRDKIKKTMTLDALLNSLQDKRKKECETILVNYFRDLNSLGDIYSFLEDWPNAIENYKTVLLLDQEYKGKIRIDILQKIHAMNQLFEIIEDDSDYEIPDFLKNDEYKAESEKLELEFLKKPTEEYMEQKSVIENLLKDKFLASCNDYVQDGKDSWWEIIIKEMIENDLFNDFVEEINKEFEDDLEYLKKIIAKKDMKFLIRKWLRNIKKYRDNSLEPLKKLIQSDVDKFSKNGSDCHLRKSKDIPAPKNKCKLCVLESNVTYYERWLFVKDSPENDILKPQKEEILLELILKFGKLHDLNTSNCLKSGDNFFKVIKLMKGEVQQFILIKNKIDKLIRAKDEISSSKTFFEELNERNTKREEVVERMRKLKDDVKTKESEMKKNYGRYLYLKTLEEENCDSRDCPICFAKLDGEYCVLQCGHSYCSDCIKSLLGVVVPDFVKCSICRELTKGCDVGLVNLAKKSTKPDLNVLGNHSTKINAVVKTIKDLQMSDPSVKIIIFSTWEIVLKILRNALNENGISYRDMIENKKWKEKKWEAEKYFEDRLKEFKNPYSSVTALLLPLHLGSKGLNLIEATHVFLIEPILNPAEELQAIGRVHRLGQTKKTVVHRFLVKGTIEEKIHSAVVSKAKEKWDRKEATLGDLKNLFDIGAK